jgi:hypothetical protein
MCMCMCMHGARGISPKAFSMETIAFCWENTSKIIKWTIQRSTSKHVMCTSLVIALVGMAQQPELRCRSSNNGRGYPLIIRGGRYMDVYGLVLAHIDLYFLYKKIGFQLLLYVACVCSYSEFFISFFYGPTQWTWAQAHGRASRVGRSGRRVERAGWTGGSIGQGGRAGRSGRMEVSCFPGVCASGRKDLGLGPAQ